MDTPEPLTSREPAFALSLRATAAYLEISGKVAILVIDFCYHERKSNKIVEVSHAQTLYFSAAFQPPALRGLSCRSTCSGGKRGHLHSYQFQQRWGGFLAAGDSGRQQPSRSGLHTLCYSYQRPRLFLGRGSLVYRPNSYPSDAGRPGRCGD